MCKAVEIGKRGDVLRYHPGIKNLTTKKILSINFYPKMSQQRIYI